MTLHDVERHRVAVGLQHADGQVRRADATRLPVPTRDGRHLRRERGEALGSAVVGSEHERHAPARGARAGRGLPDLLVGQHRPPAALVERVVLVGHSAGCRGQDAFTVGVEHRDGQQRLTGRTRLDLGAHLRAHAAVEARRPPAVVDVGLVQRVLPVLPQPVTVEPRVEVVPRQHLVALAVTRGVPVDVDGLVGQRLLGRSHPAGEREVLAPPVEAATVVVHRLDDFPHATVAAREQSLDDAGLAVVVAEADGLGELAVGADGVAQLGQSRVGLLVAELADPLERRVRLGHEPADRHRAANVARSGDLSARRDDLLGEVGDLQHVVVGLGR